ncbi:nicotinate (nicotinamide) nucleotide adenylyltransferase [candidate division KSB1 bacterium 4572_119]|nr:MAG: nicotinate (nicotinamide) nucleotide adenylyltransferase [candidate division KSB1 bacterium 4572_119]
MENQKLKIGLLGGSFDPIHLGHIRLATWTRKKLSLDKIIFVPAAIPPHKQHLALTDPHHRLQMLKIALKNETSFEVSNVELERQGISYTIDTVLFFKNKYNLQKKNLYLLIGADNLVYFQNWKEPQKICDNCQVCVYRRPGIDLSSLVAELQKQVVFLKTPLIPISSSLIRFKIKSEQMFNDLVPQEVIDYI